jgi:outer membrane lipoprotein SlyB
MNAKIKTLLFTLALSLPAAMISCTPGERGAVTGGLIGAGTGALITGGSTGALVGGAVGAVAGSEISKKRAARNRYYRY